MHLEDFNHAIFFFSISQKMSFFPRGSAPDQSSIPPDLTMQTPWTSTSTKKEHPRPMISTETAGTEGCLNINICRMVVSVDAWSRERVQTCRLHSAAFQPLFSSLPLLLPLQVFSYQLDTQTLKISGKEHVAARKLEDNNPCWTGKKRENRNLPQFVNEK